MIDYIESEWTDWLPHDPSKGRPAELADDYEKIRIKTRAGESRFTDQVHNWYWESFGQDGDILAYKRKKSAVAAHEAEQDTAEINGGGDAFPVVAENGLCHISSGLTARQYAAIHLKVPNSGTPWLDAMIMKAKRDELAAKMFPAVYAAAMAEAAEGSGLFQNNEWPTGLAFDAYRMANAMLIARGDK